jgi:signal transduction histidine kinase
VAELRIEQRRYLYTTAPFAGYTVAFVRDLTRELGILPQLRRVLAGTAASALLIALVLASLLTAVLLRPVRTLSEAAQRLSSGNFDAPLPRTAVRELSSVSDSFGAMRNSLAGRLRELGEANRLLEERQARLSALQSELLRRERVAVSARMVGELAHEIRNPVASLRNCLELLYRRLGGDPQGREYASLAIDELLRMHELAERMLDLNRPRGAALASCDAAAVSRDVVALTSLGRASEERSLRVSASGDTRAAIAPDTLKQVLLNLVQNACEAVPERLVLGINVSGDGAVTVIEVSDNGPGVPPAVRGQIFDPFFTTRGTAGGMGLGLFVAEGIVRAHGGTVSVADAPTGGALFRVTLPTFEDMPTGSRTVGAERLT